MFNSIMKSVFGSANDRYVKSLGKIVDRINALEPQMQALSDAELAAQTDKFRALLAEGKTLDDILPEAFATVREASVRVLGMRHFDVQMVGGIVLHRGEIAEMRTGEGKTLVATLATYLNAIEGKGVHVVTVNDYLAARDSEWMGRLHKFLGLTVGVIVPNISEQQRRDAYNSDITYSTNNELGFDYLRDNMKHERGQMVQRPFNFAIVDEVDSILIDEARTPLIISGPTEDKSDLYLSIDEVVKTFPEDWYEKDEKQRNIQLTEDGTEQLEKLLIERGLLESNPATKARCPTVKAPAPVAPSVSSVEAHYRILLKSDPDMALVVRLAACLGIRRAEILALKWHHIDLESGSVAITDGLTNTPGIGQEKTETKTGRFGWAVFPLDEQLAGELIDHRTRLEKNAAQLGVSPPDDGFVFSSSPLGEAAWHPDTPSKRLRRHMLNHPEIPPFTLKNLRAFVSTEVIARGASLQSASAILRHESTQTTAKYYNAVREDAARSAVLDIQRIF